MYARACALAVIVAGCGSFGTSGDDAHPSADGGAVTGDGGAPVAEGGASSDGAAPASCPPGALFCDAFDGRTLVQGEWDLQTVARGGMLALDSNLFKSAPSSLRATTGGSAVEADAYLTKAMHDVATSVHVRFAMRIASLDGVTYARVFAGTADGRDFEVSVDASKFVVHTVDTNGALNYDVVDTVPTVGAWRLVDYALVLTRQGSVTITVDGATLYSKPLSLGDGSPIGELKLRFGVTSRQAVDVSYDDLSVVQD